MTFLNYLELLKLRIGVVIALTAVVGYLAVAERVSAVQIVLLVLAMLMGSAASSVFNHYYDRDIDRKMHRTANRPMARDLLVHPTRVLWMAAALLVLGLSLALFAFNSAVALHLFLGSFFYGIVYTVWLKRRTWLNIVIGGAAGSFAVLAGAAAVNPQSWFLPMLLAIVLFLWTPSHFWSLAILLKDDYAKAGVPMLPVLVGEKRTAQSILFNSLLLVGASLLPWGLGLLGPTYGALAALSGAAFLWANLKLLQTPHDRRWARINFFGSMQHLLAIFIAIILDVHL
ncbi:MAG: protoheme IX farnesyltransferase [Rhodospirillales bacterium]|nr:protoheme IX farnesyltransferase [Rhodospirillales bacterium]